MKVLVTCKHVVDFNVTIRVKSDGADHGLVGDWFDIVPQVTAALG